MLHKIILLTFFSMALAQTSLAQTRETWKKIENLYFSFSIPKDFKKANMRGIDSFVEEYVTDGIDLSFDFGMYSNNFQGWSGDTKFENVKIDGKDGRIGTTTEQLPKGFRYSIQVYVKVNHFEALSMNAACKSETEVAIVRKIFGTIVFKSENSKP